MTPRVLAVEDTPSLRALLEAVLKRAGYDVTLAEHGGEAAEAFERGAFDAVVMDLQMPVLDGFGAAERMRAHEKALGRAPAPILALTANTDAADLRRCLEGGFTATVRKPFSREELLAALSIALGTAAGAIEVAVDPEIAVLVPGYLAEVRADVGRMREALARGDIGAFGETAHKLVGSGASLGFKPLSEQARAAENAAKAADAKAAAAALDALSTYLAKVKVKTVLAD
ncbi:MAG: response regulator [Elusimicrobiota bacterium]|nr:MAG: response regulator [Elusimicrobiota bacterium]